MAYSLGNFINDPSPNDRFMMIYNSNGVLVVTVDPYASTFFQKSKYVYVVTDGKMNYDNVLDFSTNSEADGAVARLNDVKKIFFDRSNNTLSLNVESTTFNAHTGDTNLHINANERLALNETNNLSDSNPFATIADISIASGDTKQVKVSGGDDTEGYLGSKITGSTYITLDILNNNSAETLRINTVGLTPLSTFYNHTGNTNNPHNVTLIQLSGLSLSTFNNYVEHTLSQLSGVSLNVYNTFSGTTVPNTYATISNLNNHTGNTNNPHNVTLIQLSGVSLSTYNNFTGITLTSLSSYTLLSDYNTYTGTTVPNTYATIVNLNSHTGNTNNPHNVTLIQLSGVSLNVYNTFSGDTITNLNNHTGNTSNPHNVTATQLSAYTITQTNANFLSANTSYYTQNQANNNFLSANTSYYTQLEINNNFLSATTTVVDLGGYSATTIDSLITGVTYLLNNHTGNTNNPHNVTASQISTYTINQADANFLSANTSYYTQAQADENFLSANTSFYTQNEINNNFVSAVTYYTFTGTTVPDTYATIVNLNNHTGNTNNPHDTTLSGLTDTSINNPLQDDVLIYSGGSWVNSSPIDLSTLIIDTLNVDTLTATAITALSITAVTYYGDGSNLTGISTSQLSGVSISDFNTYTGVTAPDTYATIVNFDNHTGNTSNPHNVTTSQISAYTMSEVDGNFLSANTFIPSDFYTTGQADANFLSANTSFYTQDEVDNLLTGVTVDLSQYYTSAQTDENFLSANTSIVSLSIYNTFTGTTVPDTYATIVNLDNHTGNTNNPHQTSFSNLTSTAHTHSFDNIDNRFIYNSLTSSTYTIDSFSTSVTDGCHWYYVIRDGANVEAGTVIGVWDLDSSAITHTIYSTDELGDTSGITFDVDINVDTVRLLTTIVSGNWDIKIRRFNI